MPALVNGDDAKLVAQFARYVVPVMGVASLSVYEQQVAVGGPSPVQVVDVEAVDLYVVVGGDDGCHGFFSCMLFAPVQ